MKRFYNAIEQAERILNKAKGERYTKLKAALEDKFYPHKARECYGYEGRREPKIKFSVIG